MSLNPKRLFFNNKTNAILPFYQLVQVKKDYVEMGECYSW